MVESKYYALNEVFDNENQPGNLGKVATQLMKLHHIVAARQNPVVLEFGVHKGRSTGILAHACEQTGGQLISVDIDDCADVIESPVWTFIQSSDTEIDHILYTAPVLRGGVDLLYIDSLHAAEHVSKLLMGWYPYIKANGYIALDDVDPMPYMAGQRKDDVNREIAWREIGDAVMDFFYANRDDLFLEIQYGSTGQALFHKLTPLHTAPKPPTHIPRRRWSLRSTARRILKPIRSS